MNKSVGDNVTGTFIVKNDSNSICTVYCGFSLISPVGEEIPYPLKQVTFTANQEKTITWQGPPNWLPTHWPDYGLYTYRMCVWRENPSLNPNQTPLTCTSYLWAFNLV